MPKRPGDRGHAAGDLAGRSRAMLVVRGTGGEGDDPSQARAGAVMRARVGDVLMLPGRASRSGLVIGVVGTDGAPPYVIKWLSDGHIAMVTPDQYSRIVPAACSRHGQLPPDDQ